MTTNQTQLNSNQVHSFRLHARHLVIKTIHSPSPQVRIHIEIMFVVSDKLNALKHSSNLIQNGKSFSISSDITLHVPTLT